MKDPSNPRYYARFRNEEWWEIEHVLDATRGTCRILDAKYLKYDISKIVPDSKHLKITKKSMLYDVLIKYELPFDGSLRTWKMKPVDIEINQATKHYP